MSAAPEFKKPQREVWLVIGMDGEPYPRPHSTKRKAEAFANSWKRGYKDRNLVRVVGPYVLSGDR